MPELKDYYKVLQVDPAADPEVITAAYRRLALKYHPDTNKSPGAVAKMQVINEAYETLGTARSRAEYDQERRRKQHEREAAAQRTQETDQPGEWINWEQRRRAEAEAAWNERENRRREVEAERMRAEYEKRRAQQIEQSDTQLGCVAIMLFAGVLGALFTTVGQLLPLEVAIPLTVGLAFFITKPIVYRLTDRMHRHPVKDRS